MNTVTEDLLRQLLQGDYGRFLAFLDTAWVGPYTIGELLDNCLNGTFPRPPLSDSVYLVTALPWQGRPSPSCLPLYVGSTTGRRSRFRARMGDLIADAFGFFQTGAGHSSGGQSLYRYCGTNNVNPRQLHIAWLARCGCCRCAEQYFWRDLSPKLNRKQPPLCEQHFDKASYLSII